MKHFQLKNPVFVDFIFTNPKFAWFWLIARVYVGWAWLSAGWGKVIDPTWAGEQAGESITGFVTRAIAKATGEHPAVQSWYATFLEKVILPIPEFWSYVVAYGELLVGIGLILGIITGIAALSGIFMNMNFLLAGTTSTNPILLIISVGILLAWKTAGYFGADYYIFSKIKKLRK
jgi:thiosulfate dehydrogenase [quinone] large subunit